MSAIKLFSLYLVIRVLTVYGLCADAAALKPHKYVYHLMIQSKKTVWYSYCTFQRIWEILYIYQLYNLSSPN